MSTQTKIGLILGAVVLCGGIYFISSSSSTRDNLPVNTEQPAPSTAAKPATTHPPGGSQTATPRRTAGRSHSNAQTPTNRNTQQTPVAPNRSTPSVSNDLEGARPTPADSTNRSAMSTGEERERRLATRGQPDTHEASIDPDADKPTPGAATHTAEQTTTTPPPAAERTMPMTSSATPGRRRGTTPTTATPTTAAPAATPPAPKMRTHVVVAGDTFSTLALQYYGSQRYTGQLIRANPQVSNPDMLKIGMTLKIPDLGQTLPERRESETLGPDQYRVRAGDSFASIAREKLGDERRWPELYEINKDRLAGGPDTIKPGLVIYLAEPPRQQ